MSTRSATPGLDRTTQRVIFYAALGISACSFQDFDYLQAGSMHSGGSSGTGSGGASAGESASGGKVSAGGSAQHGGVGGAVTAKGGSPGQGGAAGSAEAGSAGNAGSGDAGAAMGGSAPTEGGQGGAGGDVTTGGTGGGPLVGNLLANPSFEMDLLGWTVDPSSAVANRYVYVQYPTGGGVVVDGQKELATWHDTAEYSVYVYQKVNGLVPGTYSFKGNFSSTQSRGAYLFARNCGGAEQQEVIPTNTFNWFEISIPQIDVTGSSCEVGFFVHAVAQDWLNADLFTFEKVP